MKNAKVVDARNLSCPQPVILARQAILQYDQVAVIVNDEIALENVKRMGTKLKCSIKTTKKKDGSYEVLLTKTADNMINSQKNVSRCNEPGPSGPFVIVFSADKMGRGNDELGGVLIRTFIHTICEQDEKPQTMIFYNTGVQLAMRDSDVLDDLRQLAEDGVEMLVCGTCLNYFDIKDKLAVGVVSNMYDITDTMSRAGRLIAP
jgi:selenium metabolism protein YedF